jgi:hypothetical protein
MQPFLPQSVRRRGRANEQGSNFYHKLSRAFYSSGRKILAETDNLTAGDVWRGDGRLGPAHYAEINYRELRIEEERLSSEIVRDSVFR